MTNPDDWKPQTPDDLLGITKKIAKSQIARAKRNSQSKIRLLLHGEPGCGKSVTCEMIANSIAESHNISHLSACQVTADTVRDWIDEGNYMRSSWRVYHIEECDAFNPTVQLLMLQFLDKLPPQTMVLCTSNLGMGELSDRFQSRFQCYEIKRPSVDSVAKFLANWSQLGTHHAKVIAENTNGDVRAALNDVQGYIDNLEVSYE